MRGKATHREPTLALVATTKAADVPLVRLHSECATGDIFQSQRCDCGPQLQAAQAQIAAEGGCLLYLRQEGRGIGLAAKLQTYVLQSGGYDTYDANCWLGYAADARDYTRAAAILTDLGLTKVRLLTNNPEKVRGLAAAGITVVAQVPLRIPANVHNAAYLHTKKVRFQHDL